MRLLAALFIFAISLFHSLEAHAQIGRSLFSNSTFEQYRQQKLDAQIKTERAEISQLGFRQWDWDRRTQQNSPDSFIIFPIHEEVRFPKAREFMTALSAQKAELMDLYKDKAPVTDAEYVMLARLAVGFLGAESEFFRSSRYVMKEACIFCFAAAKWGASLVGLADNDEMSRGPIQMKNVPDLIEEKYGITERDLNDPTNAARAIMGYLIEALAQLKRTAKNNDLTYINADTYEDYLPYIYFGSSRKLINGTATPDKNLYIQKMRGYMEWVEVYAYTSPSSRPAAHIQVSEHEPEALR